MKTKLLLLLTFTVFINVNAQIGFQERTILGDETKNYDPITTSVIGDIDKDGDLDIIFSTTNKIGWYENTNKLRRFGGENIISTNVKSVRSIFVSDLDGDGDLDVISASNDDDKIAWYENLDGKGNFGSQKIISTGVNGARSVLASDIDNDGDLDVISGSFLDGKIYLHENTDGHGNFSNPIVIAQDGVMMVYTADFDNDGDMDILSGSKSAIVWYENLDGKGNFSVKQSVAPVDGVITMVNVKASDLDSDGDIDVIVSVDSMYGEDKLVWYKNTNGLGVFGDEQIIDNTINDATFLNISDIDGDGYTDITNATTIIDFVNNTTSDSEISWYKNNGLGVFDAKQVITTYIDNPTSVHAVDIDNDGNLDILSTSSNDAKIAWYRYIDSLDKFGIQQIISGNTGTTWEILSFDIDGDGDLDILSSSKHNNTVAWYENLDGQGNFSSQKVISSSELNVQSSFAGDFDGDGDLDVAANFYLADDRSFSWYENLDGKGNFEVKNEVSNRYSSAQIAIRAADFDNDGDIDIVRALDNLGRVEWYENKDGLGNFGVVNVIYDFNKATSMNLGDIDGDGDLDVIFTYSDQGYGYINWAENNNGLQYKGFIGPKLGSVATYLDGVNSARVEDFDNDGKMDIVASTNPNSGTSKIIWFKGIDGLGNFSGPIDLNPNATKALSVYPVDIDNDGDIDVVSADSSSNTKVSWYENLDGLANFSTEQTIPTLISFWASRMVHCADINNDGKIDIINASISLEPIVWYENLGTLGNTISGKLYFDENKDGCDINDLTLSNIMVVASNGINSFATFSDNDGNYLIHTNTGNFTTSLDSNIPNYYNITPNSHSSNFIGLNNYETINFCLESNQSVNDVNIALIPLRQARPGFFANYQLVIHNAGITQLSGNILLEFNNLKLNFLTASETIASQTSNSLSFNYNNLNPFETRTISLVFNVFTPPTTNIGDILNFTATINPIPGDNTENDNVFELDQTVIGSYDPNDILVLEGSQILLEDVDDYLHYIIRFQNTGTADAINVKVDNVLDSNLDWTTMQLVSSSHSNRVEIRDGNEMSFIFDGIYLPDSTHDEPNSHGFIAYKIKPKSNVDVGDIIPNQADIFFDFNPAITTNMVTTEVTSSLGVDDNVVSKFYLYPNPTSGIIKVNSIVEINRLEVYNNLGQVVIFELNNDSVDISSLSIGLYYIKIEDVFGNSEIKKIVKK